MVVVMPTENMRIPSSAVKYSLFTQVKDAGSFLKLPMGFSMFHVLCWVQDLFWGWCSKETHKKTILFFQGVGILRQPYW